MLKHEKHVFNPLSSYIYSYINSYFVPPRYIRIPIYILNTLLVPAVIQFKM